MSEVPDREHYLAKPHWQGGNSGIVIGFDYDLGSRTQTQIKRDWPHLPNHVLNRILTGAGVTGADAKAYVDAMNDIEVSYDEAVRQWKKT